MSLITRDDTESTLDVRPVLPRVNLIPPEFAIRRRMRRLQVAGGATVVATVALCAGGYVLSAMDVAHAQNELSALRDQRSGVQAQVGRYANVAATYRLVDERTKLRDQAVADKVNWSGYLSDLSTSTPTNVWLNKVDVTPATLNSAATSAPTTLSSAKAAGPTPVATMTFGGNAKSYADVAAWLDSLTTEKAYTNAYLTAASEQLVGGAKVVQFTGTVTVTSAALASKGN